MKINLNFKLLNVKQDFNKNLKPSTCYLDVRTRILAPRIGVYLDGTSFATQNQGLFIGRYTMNNPCTDTFSPNFRLL